MDHNVRIGCFNLLNLVLPEVTFYGRRKYSQKDYNKKTTWIGEKLKRMDGHIVGFQEIFHHEALEEAIRKSNVYQHAEVITANPQGDKPVVGLVSRFPVIEHEVIADFPDILAIEGLDVPIHSFSRPVLRALIEFPTGDEVSVYVVHLKSKRPMFPDDENIDRFDPLEKARGSARSLIRRAAEATALRQILLKELKDRDHPVVVIGDVNDNGNAVTTRVISGEPPYRNMPQKVKRELWDVLLYHVKDIQARRSYNDFYFSHIHNGHYEALDHIMVSQELVIENPEHIGRVGQVILFNDHLVDETISDDRVENWQSDHAQIVVELEMGGKR